MSLRNASAIGLFALLASGATAQTANFNLAGYGENFDSMGTTGTAAPSGWAHFTTGFGSNTTWATTIPASGANSVALLPVNQAATTLVAVTTPTANQNNGYNAAASSSATSDRVLATAPTTVAGAIIQLSLNNNTGYDFVANSVLTISFDTIRYSAVGTVNQLPGYWLFVSFDGSAWSNVSTVASPNPDITTVPNTAGTTSRSVDLTLASAWAANSTIYFRWVDDNAQQTSPDQIIGLNNVSIVPTPGAAALLVLGAMGAARRRRAVIA